MENIGPVSSYAEAYRAIRFLSRLSKMPIRFFGIEPGRYHHNPWVTYNKKLHDHLFAENKTPCGMSLAELAGALDAWLCLERRAKRKQRCKTSARFSLSRSVELEHGQVSLCFPEAWEALKMYPMSCVDVWHLSFWITGQELSADHDLNDTTYVWSATDCQWRSESKRKR